MSTHRIRLLTLAAVAALLAGCQSTRSGPPRQSGFLSDYSLLQPHPDTVNRPHAWRYTAPDVDLRDYDRLLIDPVKVSLDPASKAHALGKDQLVRTATMFQDILVDTISPYYTVAHEPGSTTLRLRVALTDLEAGEVDSEEGPALDLVGVAVEAELIDSTTGRVVAAALDRAGTEQTGRTVEGTFRVWAKRVLDYLEGNG